MNMKKISCVRKSTVLQLLNAKKLIGSKYFQCRDLEAVSQNGTYSALFKGKMRKKITNRHSRVEKKYAFFLYDL